MKLEICYHRIDESHFDLSDFVAKEAAVARALGYDVEKSTPAVLTKLEEAIFRHNDAEEKLTAAKSTRAGAYLACRRANDNIFLGQFGEIKAWIKVTTEDLKVGHLERLVFRTDKALPRDYQGHHRDKDVPARVDL